VQGNTGEIGNDNVARNFGGASFAGEVLNVAKGLGLGLAEILAEALVLDEQESAPEQVDVAVVAGDGFYGSSKLATALRAMPKTLKNSFQKVCFSACSRLTPVQSFEKAMARWRISFQESGIGGG
jgi:hypothetical protein